jgi:hypothetical protein
MYVHQTRRRWGRTAMRGSVRPVIDRRYLAGGGHSAWSAPLKEVDKEPDEAGALLDFHFTNPSAGSERVKKAPYYGTCLFTCFDVQIAPPRKQPKRLRRQHTRKRHATPTPSRITPWVRRALIFCAPHGHPFLSKAVAFVSYRPGFVLVRARVRTTSKKLRGLPKAIATASS